MRKHTSRIFSLVLALVLVLSLVPATTAHAAESTKIYFENTANWSTVYAYYWANGGEVTWPGKGMTKVSGNIYVIEVPAGMKNIIFNNGSGTQTGDLVIPTDGKNMFNYTNNSWGTYVNECTHNYGTANVVKATCTTDGYTSYTCSLCGDVKKENVVTATGHSYNSSNVCTVCGASEAVIYFTNAGNWSTVNIYYWSDSNELMVTWPGKGMTKVDGNIYKYVLPSDAQYVIFNNGSTKTDDLTIPADKNMYTYNGGWSSYNVCNHSWGNGTVTKQPTCDVPGVKTYTCSLCGETKTETVAAAGHKYVNDTCTVCGAAKPCDHSWDNGTVTKQPTCEGSGVKTFTCSKCSETKTETIVAKGHNMVNGSCSVCGVSDNCPHLWRAPSTVSATCEKEGSYSETCLICGAKRTEVIPAKGHKYSAGRCYVCGKEQANIQYIDISNAAELLAFANRVNAGETDLNARLTADIDLGGASWTAIGYYCKNGTDSLFYKGRFNGNGHTISNFTVAGNDSVGLFGYCEIAVIENLGVINATATGWNAGAIAGYAPTTLIRNCFAKDCKITGYTTNPLALVSNSAHVGAVAGSNGGTVKNCYAINCTLTNKHDGDLSSMAPVGGTVRSNNYYCNVTGAFTATNGATEVTAAQMASGEVTFKLNNGVVDGTQAWYQTCGQGLPAFSGKTVYETANGTYVNNAVACNHSWNPATCTAPKTCSKCGATEGTSLGHTWKDATCTAPKTCTKCGATEGTTLGHSYVDGICGNCGAADPNYVVPTQKFDITLANLTLGNDLTLYFYIPVDACADWTGTYAVVKKPYADGTPTATVTVPFENWESGFKSGGKDLYRVAFNGIAAKEMTDEVTIEIFNAEGKAISNPGKESVRSYLDRFMKANATDATKMRLAVDMLNYGAAAQTHFGYNTANLANAGLTAAQKAFGTATAPACVNGNVKGANAKGSNLTLESSILMNFYFNGLTEDMYAVVTFTDHTGKAHSEKLGAHDGSRFTVNQVVVADARQLVTVTVYNADGSVYGTCTDSVESYVARARDAQAKGLDLYEAIIKFADSAYLYLHNR